LSKFINSTELPAAKNIQNILKLIYPDSTELANAMANMEDDASKSFERILVNYATMSISDIYRDKVSIQPNLQELPETDRFNTMNEIFKNVNIVSKQSRTVLHNALAASLFDIMKGIINSHTANKFSDILHNNKSNRFFNNVFAKWNLLTPTARTFYRHHLHVFKKSLGTDKWVDQMESNSDEGGTDLKQNVSNNIELLRLNLTHSGKGKIDTLFSHTLPFIPVKDGMKLWYTNDTKRVVSIELNNKNNNVLKVIYDCIYTGNECNVNDSPISFFTATANTYTDLDLDYAAFVKNFLKIAVQEQPTLLKDEVAVDMVTQMIYNRDKDGLFRMVNGKRINVNNDSYPREKCDGTVLNSNKCDKIVHKCLLNGKTEDLAECLTELKDQNLFKVAYNQLQNVDPRIAVQILKTFGVGKTMINGIETPEDYNSWLRGIDNNIADRRVRDAILNNNGLANYLQGVIAFVTANPAILNKNIDSHQIRMSHPEYTNTSMLGKRPFVRSMDNTGDARLATSNMFIQSTNFVPDNANQPPQITKIHSWVRHKVRYIKVEEPLNLTLLRIH
jgi:hypothetical protein